MVAQMDLILKMKLPLKANVLEELVIEGPKIQIQSGLRLQKQILVIEKKETNLPACCICFYLDYVT